MKDEALLAAIQAAGSGRALAAQLGVTPAAIGLWRRVPTDRVLAVEAATGIPRHRLRPDVFGVGERKGALAQVQETYTSEARALGLDPEAIARTAIKDAVCAEKQRRWIEDHRDAFAAHTEWVEKHGVPLAKYRMF